MNRHKPSGRKRRFSTIGYRSEIGETATPELTVSACFSSACDMLLKNYARVNENIQHRGILAAARKI
jgi:hypothetical protein